MSFGQDIEGYVLTNLNNFTVTIYQSLMASWPGMAFTTLYIVIVGYMIIKGNAGEHAKDLGVSIILLLMLQSIVQTGYTEWVSDPVISLAKGLGKLAVDVSDSRGYDVFTSLDDGIGQIITTVGRISPTGNILTNAWTYIEVTFASLLMVVCFGLMYLVYLVLDLIAYFSLYMMLMVGGVFLWLGAFKAARPYTMAWLKAIANYVVWIFFLSAVMGFFMSTISDSVADLAAWDVAVDGAFPPSLGKMIFLTFLVYNLLLKTADWSASLTGGTSMSPGIVTSGAGAIGGAVKAGLTKGQDGKSAFGNAAREAGGLATGAGRARAFSALKGVFKK